MNLFSLFIPRFLLEWEAYNVYSRSRLEVSLLCASKQRLNALFVCGVADVVLVARAAMPHKRRIRTLVVDDSADFVRYLCAFLDALSTVDVIAKGRNGRDALVLAHEWLPDLVLMDVRMPEMTGLEAAAQLTRDMPGVVVILMSAFEDEEARRESGAFAFVMKEDLPLELPRLLELAASQKGWDNPTKNCA
jgi:CheY-like chemotaxis protein